MLPKIIRREKSESKPSVELVIKITKENSKNNFVSTIISSHPASALTYP